MLSLLHSDDYCGPHSRRIKARVPAVVCRAPCDMHPGAALLLSLAHSAPTTLASLNSRHAPVSGPGAGCFPYSSRGPVISFKCLVISGALRKSTVTNYLIIFKSNNHTQQYLLSSLELLEKALQCTLVN